jgi:hypothetical protein
VIDLSSSSDVEDTIVDTSHDEDFAKRLFGDLIHDVLGLPGDGKIIILSDSNEEEEVREEKATSAEAIATSVAINPASITSTADADKAPKGVQGDCSDKCSPDRDAGDGTTRGDEVELP